jgi:O-antigen/teichoic acid export membrane protein
MSSFSRTALRQIARLAAPVFDQGSLAALNFLVSVLVARAASASEFGRFALMWTVFSFVLYAWTFLPGAWILSYQDEMKAFTDDAQVARGGVLFAGVLGLLTVPLTALAYFLISAGNLVLAVSVAVSTGGWMIISAFRFGAYRTGERFLASRIVLLNLLVFGLLFGTLHSLSAAEALGIPEWVVPPVSHAGSTTLCAGIALLTRRGPRADGLVRQAARASFTSYRSIGTSFGVNGTIMLGVPSTIGLVAGLGAVAGYRGGQTLAGLPLQIPQGLQPILLRQLADQDGSSPAARQSVLRLWQLATAVLLGGSALIATMVTDVWGERVLGDTWQYAEDALPWLLVGAIFSQWMYGVEATCRVTDQMATYALWRAIWLLPTFALVVVGADWSGARGAAIAMLTANATLFLTLRYRVSLRRARADE